MTAQIHEILIVDGEETSMAFCPDLPDSHPRIKRSDPDAAVDEDGLIFGSTACWRGYEGTWEVKDGRFYLVGLDGGYTLSEGGPIFADWFTGMLRVPQGEMLHYVHMGFGSVYEEELHIKIENGVVISKRVIDNRDRGHDLYALGGENLPGGENRFFGDDDLSIPFK